MGQIQLLVVSLLLGSGLAWAQAGAPGSRGNPSGLDRDPQRREQIRESLKTVRQPANGPDILFDRNVVPVPPPPNYHLTPQGKAELREQLRREQNENRRGRP